MTPSEPGRAIAAVRHAKVSRTVARLVVKDIAERGLPPGTPLPTELLMAKQYQVGRSSVREALRILESQGFVMIRPGQGGGPVVGDPDGQDFGATMTMYLQVKQVRFAEIIEATAELDGMAAGLLARKVADGTVTDLEPLLAACPAEVSDEVPDEEVTGTGVDFHTELRRLGDNFVLEITNSAVAHIFTERSLGAMHSYRWSAEERARLSEQHRTIVAAIRDGQPDLARERAIGHLREIGARVIEVSPGLAEEIVDWR